MEIASAVRENDWREALNRLEGASIYHTPEWKRVLESAFGFEPCYLFSVDETGMVSGILPLFHIKSRITGERLCSVPFSHMCGPVGDADSRNALIERAVELYRVSGAKNIEIRSNVEHEGFFNSNYFSTYILDLSPDIEHVWKKLDKGSVRWAVKRSQKAGLNVDVTRNPDDLKAFFELNCITKKDKGVPCHTLKFFHKLFEHLGDQVSLYAVRNSNNELIAGGIMSYFRGTVIYGYGAADQEHLKLYPYHAFLWKAIEDACLNGFRRFDFGRVSYDNTGLISFKKRWGTEEHKLYYGFYPKNCKPIAEGRNSLKYRFASEIIRKMPVTVYKKFSDAAFGSFG